MTSRDDRKGGRCACSAPGQTAAGPLQLKSNPNSRVRRDDELVPPAVSNVLRAPGFAMDTELIEDARIHLGAHLNDVRLHADELAGQSAAAVGARAFTAGRHIVFGSGQYAPRTAEGRKLIAHELAHVLQQADGRVAAPAGGIAVDPSAEREADKLGDRLHAVRTSSAFTTAVPRGSGAPVEVTAAGPPSGGTGSISMSRPQRGSGIRADVGPRVLQRQVAATDPDPKLPGCKTLLDLIKETVVVLIQRGADLVNDPLGLQWDNWHVPKGNAGSVVGHQQQYEGWRNRLRNLISEWDEDDCNSTGLRVPREARDLVFKPVPEPIRRPRPDTEPKPWERPGARRVAAAARGAAIGAGAGLIIGGVVGALVGGAGGTLVAPGVGTIGGGGAGAVAGATKGAGLGAGAGAAIGGLIGWLLE